MEFHVAGALRDRLGLEEALFQLSGNVILPDFRATRELAARLNELRDAAADPDRAVLAADLNAMGLLDEVLHGVVALYRQQRDPDAMAKALVALEGELGRERLDGALLAFVERFPPLAVYREGGTPESYLADAPANREAALEELLLLWLANVNPAFRQFGELFDDTELVAGSAYEDVIAGLTAFFETMPPFGPDDQPLVDLLRAPALASPDSLAGQLRFVRERWGLILSRLGGRFGDRLLLSLDVLAEDERARWMRFHGAVAATSAPALRAPTRADLAGAGLAGAEAEPERYSPDLDWMPRLVLIAKSTYVWLDQLSRTYDREIRTLDQVPDEELDTLARRGFSGLWLIGLWERGSASATIKRIRGNPEAVASAYSIAEYRIADDLGGEEALANLRERAWARGIRLASDMVPNHMAIDSRWVVEHPDWFISVDHPPFAVYSFGGTDLSSDERVGTFIEDHYYDGTDAAVVFKRLDRWTGEARYVYHGNDGTSTPWNDTAQLDYLRADVREAVIQTILHVARQFPVIRFDAAMTLAKRHFQRLWFPEPGTGGAIPSRAEHGLTKAEFDAAMPAEFWREVVDRVAAEAPGTLLLAEAFWLMEGYFVRTLGMHRVYNSAFMNMLRDERNAEYRLVLRNTLEFDPEILRRYVSFMNNPDERTAVEQFGTSDKYFGICTLMATLPGLPMFGHGQVEGFAEKYGMEYRRAYLDEQPNEGLVARHEREIAPLLHRREIFAGARDFYLYDLLDGAGNVIEDVFAYSNRRDDERALVVYHNRFARAAGWVRRSVGFAVKQGGDGGPGDGPAGTDGAQGGRWIEWRTLGDGLGLSDGAGVFYAFRDARTGLEYLRSGRDLCREGMYIELPAYACHVFLDWREVRDGEGRPYGALAGSLAGRGVPSIDEALVELRLRPVHEALRAVMGSDAAWAMVESEAAASGTGASASDRLEAGARGDDALWEPTAPTREFEARLAALLRTVRQQAGRVADPSRDEQLAQEAGARLGEIPALAELPAGGLPWPSNRAGAGILGDRADEAGPAVTIADRCGLLAWIVVDALADAADDDRGPGRAAPRGVVPSRAAALDTWRLGPVLSGELQELGVGEEAARRIASTVRALLVSAAIATPARHRIVVRGARNRRCARHPRVGWRHVVRPGCVPRPRPLLVPSRGGRARVRPSDCCRGPGRWAGGGGGSHASARSSMRGIRVPRGPAPCHPGRPGVSAVRCAMFSLSIAGRRGGRPLAALTVALALSLVPLAATVAAATHHELVAMAAGNWAAGVARTFAVTAHNEDHTVDTGYTGTVHFSSSDSLAVLPADYTFTAADAGVHTFTATLKTAGPQTVTTWDVPHGSISGAMTVKVAAAAPAKLAFVQEPGDGVADYPVPQQPVVVIQDEFGNWASAASAEVALAPLAGPAATLTCKPATSLTTVAGVAAFVACKLDASGSGFVLRASAAGLASADSAAFDLAAMPGVTARMNSSRTLISYGESTTLDLEISAGGRHRVRLYRMDAGSIAWVATGPGSVETDASGRYTFTVGPKHSALYQVRSEADEALGPMLSDTVMIGVRQTVQLEPAAVALRAAVARGSTVVYTARVRPAKAGVRPVVSFVIAQHVGARWLTREKVKVTASAAGVATLSHRWSTRGEWEIRAQALATGYNLIGSSPRVRLLVR